MSAGSGQWHLIWAREFGIQQAQRGVAVVEAETPDNIMEFDSYNLVFKVVYFLC